MEVEYSDKDVAIYALNYAISKLHDNQETFKEYIEHTKDLRNVKSYYSDEKKYTFEELNQICTQYGDDSMLDFNLVFDKWFINYLRYYKIKKIKNAIRQ